MNMYLISVGSQVFKMRDLLNLPQQTLAEKMGVSRPVIINIEKDPTNMTLTTLMALYVVVFGEIAMKRKSVKDLDYDLWDKSEKRESLIESIIKSGVDKKLISAALGTNSLANGIIAGNYALIPSGLISNVISLFSKPSKGKNENKINKNDIKKLALDSINLIESDLCSCFNIQEPKLEYLLENIKKGDFKRKV